MIKEVHCTWHSFVLVCVSQCLHSPLITRNSLFSITTVLKKKKNQLSSLSSIHSDILSIYMCWHAVCVCVGLIVMSISWDNVTAVRGLNKKNELLAPVIP